MWSNTAPDLYLKSYTANTGFDATPVRNVVLYNSDDTHYNLLVTLDSPLSLHRYNEDVSENTEATPKDPDDVELEKLIDVEEEDLVASPLLKMTIPQDDPSTLSPQNFIPCSSGPGRPKVSRQGAASLLKITFCEQTHIGSCGHRHAS